MGITVAILGVNTILLLSLAVAAWRKRGALGVKWFGYLQVAAAVWTLFTITSLVLSPSAFQVRIWELSVASSTIVVTLWFAFILAYTGHDRWLKPRRFLTLAAPLLLGALLHTVAGAWDPLIRSAEPVVTASGTIVQAEMGVLGSAIGLYIYAVFMAGLGLVFVSVLDGERLFLGSAAPIFLGSLITVLASVSQVVADIPFNGYPLTEVALGAQSLLLGYAVFRQEFFQAIPGIARIGERRVFENLGEGFLVANNEGLVVRANPEAKSLIDGQLVGRELDVVLQEFGLCSSVELPTKFEHQGRTYHVTLSEVSDRKDADIGDAIVIRDITDLVRHQQRLQVLNRILRHNVRNDVTVIHGIASVISEQADDEMAELGERIARCAESLEGISEKANNIEVASGPRANATSIDITELIDSIVAPLRESHPEVTIRVQIEANELVTDRHLLSLILCEALENAIEHAGDTPEINLTVRPTGESVTFSIADDGPGIPDVELAPIRSGQETPLQHSSSLGLWLIYWETQTLGGTLQIENSERGATIKIEVPNRDTSEGEPASVVT